MGGLVWQKQVSMAWTSNYIPQILRDAVDHYQIPQCTCLTSHNVPLRTEMDIFLFWMVHYGMWNRCIMWVVDLVYYLLSPALAICSWHTSHHNARPCYIGSLCTYDDVCVTRRYQWHGQVITSHRYWGMQYIKLTNPKVPLFHTHNALFRTAMCTFLFWMVHCGIWKRCIMWFVDVVYYFSLPPIPASGTQVLIWCKKPIFTCLHDDMVHVITLKRLNQGSCVCGTYNTLSLDIHAL